MPTESERRYYARGFSDGMKFQQQPSEELSYRRQQELPFLKRKSKPKRKQKLSAWNKYVKANSKKPRFRMRSGKLNLKKMAISFRKTPAGRKRKK